MTNQTTECNLEDHTALNEATTLQREIRYCILKFSLERADRGHASVLVLSGLRESWDIANAKLLDAKIALSVSRRPHARPAYRLPCSNPMTGPSCSSASMQRVNKDIGHRRFAEKRGNALSFESAVCSAEKYAITFITGCKHGIVVAIRGKSSVSALVRLCCTGQVLVSVFSSAFTLAMGVIPTKRSSTTGVSRRVESVTYT